ncbi:hypothetical protein [Amycolatopsis sp. NPDC004378]
MGDWTSGAATIHACPPHRVRRVLDTFAEYGFTDEAEDEDTANGATLTLGEWYCGTEIRCGSATDLADELIKHAPEAAFTVYEEPAYEWLGTACTHVPGLGLFATDCDTSGDPTFTQSQILRWDNEPDHVRQNNLGVPWLTAIAAMPGGTVVEPDRFATHWNRRHDEIVVVEGRPCGGDLILPAPVTAAEVDTVLAEQGFQRAEDWMQLDETSQLWRTDVYRSPAP